MDTSDLLEMYKRMYLIRRFEDRVSELYRDGDVPGFVHLSVGQEASAVGACWNLRRDDVITSTHRGHGHCLAKGLDPEGMLAELQAKETGTNHGRGGSMHVADPNLGVFGANGIVGGGLPIAVGAATAIQIKGQDSVVVAFFGDGAVAQGTFHESINLAAVANLPVIFFCENNGWAEFSSADWQHPASLRERAAGYGCRFVQVDGTDVATVSETMFSVVNEVRSGGGPYLVEAVTHRFRGHFEGDQQKYRDAGELATSRSEHDPLVVCAKQLVESGVTNDRLQEIRDGVDAQIEAGVTQARDDIRPSADSLFDHVVSPRPHADEITALDETNTWRMMDALNQAMLDEMQDDPSVFLVGIDVSEAPFAITRGLRDRFGSERVRDTPISESAIIGTAVGASMAGMRPIAEIMYLDFIGVCFDQLMNQAAKMRYMTGGNASLPMVVRTQFGAGRSSGSQHSQSLEALLAHIPGLTVVMPSNPADAYGLLRSAIRDDNPVVFIEHRLTYGMKGPRALPTHRVPLGKAQVTRTGKHVTVVSYSRLANEVLKVAEEMAADGIEVEVIDLRTIAPIDWETIEESVRRTSRLVVVHEAVVTHGVGAEIAARAANEWFWYLDAPVGRVGAEFTPPPYSPDVEQRWLPGPERIRAEIERIVRI